MTVAQEFGLHSIFSLLSYASTRSLHLANLLTLGLVLNWLEEFTVVFGAQHEQGLNPGAFYLDSSSLPTDLSCHPQLCIVMEV